MMAILRMFGAASLLAATTAFAVTTTSDPLDVVRAFYAAHATGDHAAAAKLVSDDAQAYLRVDTASDIQRRCIDVHSLHVRLLEQNDTTAKVEALVHSTRTPRLSGPSAEHLSRQTIALRLENDVWRIAGARSAESELVDRIAETRTDDEIATLLAAHNELLAPPLIDGLLSKAMALGRKGDGRPILRLANLAHHLALATDHRPNLANAMAAQVDAVRGPGAAPAPLVEKGKEALRIAWESGHIGSIGTTTLSYVNTLIWIDLSSREAERVLRRALPLRKGMSLSSQAALVGSIAGLAAERGDLATAYQFNQEALELATADGFEAGMANIEVFLGQILETQNDSALALEHFQRAAKLEATKPYEILAQLGLAHSYRGLGRAEEAWAAANRAMEIARKTPFKGLIAVCFTTRAQLQLDRGETAETEETLRQAIAFATEAHFEPAQMRALLELGNFHARNGRAAEARKVAEEALRLSNASEHPRPDRYEALLLAARAERALGDRTAALRLLREAVDAIETARGAVAGGARQRRLFFESSSAAYTELVALLLEDGNVDEALFFAERGKGRVLLDSLGRERTDAESAMNEADRKTRDALVRELGDRNRELIALLGTGNPSKEALRTAIAAQQKSQLALDTFQMDLAAREPRLRALPVTSAAVDRASLSGMLRGGSMAFLEYVVHANATYLFVIEPGVDTVAIHDYRIDITKADLAARVEAYVKQIATRDLDYHASARALYDLLLAPAASRMKGKRVLGIIPDAALWRLPFEALRSADGKFVVETAACFYVPSISVYREVLVRRGRLADREHPQTIAAFGNPAIENIRDRVRAVHRGMEIGSLPEAAEEARRIGRVWGSGSSVYIGSAAREDVAKEEMERSRIVHFAAHGLFDDANPMFSQLVLAREESSQEDGVLQAWELMQLDLQADLVVLSACDTARGTVGAGEGLIGMSWALVAGGCPSTVATQWKVSSSSAAELMVAFHKELSRAAPGAPYTKAAALRAAQLAAMKNRVTAHPFHWAAFILVGSAH